MKPIPIRFVLSSKDLTWSEAIWGVEHGWAEPHLLIEIACARVLEGSSNPLEVELAGCGPRETSDAIDLARRLAGGSEEGDFRPWLCMSLRWLYEHRLEFADPLAIVEEVYAEFDYPREIESFVRYLPPSDGYDPNVHSQRENQAKMYTSWQLFIDNCR